MSSQGSRARGRGGRSSSHPLDKLNALKISTNAKATLRHTAKCASFFSSAARAQTINVDENADPAFVLCDDPQCRRHRANLFEQVPEPIDLTVKVGLFCEEGRIRRHKMKAMQRNRAPTFPVLQSHRRYDRYSVADALRHGSEEPQCLIANLPSAWLPFVQLAGRTLRLTQ